MTGGNGSVREYPASVLLPLRNNLMPAAILQLSSDERALSHLDKLAFIDAMRRHRRLHSIQNSFTTGTCVETIFTSKAAFNAFNTSASEGSLFAGQNMQPWIPPGFFGLNAAATGKACRLIARGVLGTTGTPTITFQARLGSTAGSSSLTGTSVGVSAAIATSSGVSNKYWRLEIDLTCTTVGIGTGNATLLCGGDVLSPGGFASPFLYPLEPSAPDQATWNATIDGGLTQYFNLSVTWSASSASNTITCLQCWLLGMN